MKEERNEQVCEGQMLGVNVQMRWTHERTEDGYKIKVEMPVIPMKLEDGTLKVWEPERPW